MKTVTIAAILLITIVVISSAVIGYSQNWFQTPAPEATSTPQPTTTPTATPTTQPTATTSPTATAKPTATTQPTPTPTTQPTTVAAMDLTLEIYGNANMDDKIDASDVTYLQQVISGSKEADSVC